MGVGASLHGRASALGARLVVAERTVEAHVSQIFVKLGFPESTDMHRRVVAVLTFLRNG